MVPGQVDKVGQVIEEVGEGDPVLSPDGLPDDDLVDIVEFVPIIILKEKFCAKLQKKEEIIRGIISNLFRHLSNKKLHRQSSVADEFDLVDEFSSNKIQRFPTCASESLTRGSNLGPPGMATLSALAVKKDFMSNK